MQEVTSKNAGMPIEGSSLEPSAPVQLVFPISTATASKVSPTEVSSESAKDLPPPNWEMWRTRGACRIWQAVLISMAINPTSEVRTILRREQPRRYAQYINRKEAVTAQYGLRPELPGARQATCRLGHAANGGISSRREAAATTESRSGLSVTVVMCVQSRVWPDQRAGLRSRAWR